MTDRDATLVRAAQAGDKAAFAKLFTRHQPMLRALCRRALGDPWLVEDAVQEAALQALLGIDRLRQPDRFGPWLGGIGLNICRRWWREPSRTIWSWDTLAGGSLDDGISSRADPADSLIEAVELRNEVRRAVAALPPGQRYAVVLFCLAGLTYAETAALLGIEIGAVKTRLHKARAALSRRLADSREEEPMTGKINRRALTKAAGALTAMAALEQEGHIAHATEERMTTTQSSDDLVEMRVADVRRRHKADEAAQPHMVTFVVMLAEVNGSRRLPIWVGEPEGTAIALHLEGVETPRPMTFAFLAAALDAAGSSLREVHIDRLAETVFYATALIEGPSGVQRRVDARPSDAINLALIAGAPIRVAPDVLAAVSDFPATQGTAAHEQSDGPAEIVSDVQAMWAQASKGAQGEEK